MQGVAFRVDMNKRWNSSAMKFFQQFLNLLRAPARLFQFIRVPSAPLICGRRPHSPHALEQLRFNCIKPDSSFKNIRQMGVFGFSDRKFRQVARIKRQVCRQ